MNRHELKTHDTYFQAVWHNLKTAELRKNDRPFQVGDTITLKEVRSDNPEQATGREIDAIIMHILSERDGPWLALDYVMLSFRQFARRSAGLERRTNTRAGGYTRAVVSPIIAGQTYASRAPGGPILTVVEVRDTGMVFYQRADDAKPTQSATIAAFRVICERDDMMLRG